MRLHTHGEYPDNWREIAQNVKDVARWTCIRCGHPHEVSSGHVLTVHHLNGDKANCRWWNLLALCQRCHLTIQGRVIPERPWLFDHSVWFRDYVCGFYAYHYACREITRDEAQATPERWLALGQPWSGVSMSRSSSLRAPDPGLEMITADPACAVEVVG